MQEQTEPRRLLLAMLEAALAAVDGRRAVSAWLKQNPARQFNKVIAIGKAAPAMARGVADTVPVPDLSALVVTRTGCQRESLPASFTLLEAGHPLPDASSLAAGQRLLEFLSSCDKSDRLLFLISGGASALVEVLPPSVSLAQLAELNRWLIGAGCAIDTINRIRQICSCIKGGRLLEFIPGSEVTALYISDVISNDPCVIGSGLLCAQATVAQDALRSRLVQSGAPAWLLALGGETAAQTETRSATRPAHHLVATLAEALQAASGCARAAAGQRYAVIQSPEYLAGDYDAAADRIVSTVAAGPGVYLWGGEVSVVLPAAPGSGGRNQQLALAVALKLRQRGLEGKVCFMAVGTDGSDGNTGDAGALVDAATLGRGSLDGLDAAQCLRRADAGTFLQASGDLIHTGPTGTNVMDLYVALRYR